MRGRIIGDILFGFLITLELVSMGWTYYSGVRGIHKMGATSLNLRSYLADPTLGLRPVGSLALSLAAAYFGFLGLFWLFIAIGSIAFPFDPGFLLQQYVLFSALTLLGIVLFFLPLTRLHRHMLRQKRVERSKIAEKIAQKLQDPNEAGSSSDLSQALVLEMTERKISSMASWPLDTNFLGKLTIIVLSVVATLIARAIAIFLRI